MIIEISSESAAGRILERALVREESGREGLSWVCLQLSCVVTSLRALINVSIPVATSSVVCEKSSFPGNCTGEGSAARQTCGSRRSRVWPAKCLQTLVSRGFEADSPVQRREPATA